LYNSARIKETPQLRWTMFVVARKDAFVFFSACYSLVGCLIFSPL